MLAEPRPGHPCLGLQHHRRHHQQEGRHRVAAGRRPAGTRHRVAGIPRAQPGQTYDGVTLVQPSLTDPCAHLTAAQGGQHPAACQYVPANWPRQQPVAGQHVLRGRGHRGQLAQARTGQVDRPRFRLQPGGWTACIHAASISGTSTCATCSAVNRLDGEPSTASPTTAGRTARSSTAYDNTTKQPGQVQVIDAGGQPERLSTSGIDFTLNYKLPHFDIGGMDPNASRPPSPRLHRHLLEQFRAGPAGRRSDRLPSTCSTQFGNITRWHATLTGI